MWVSADCPTYRHELRNVEATLAQFKFRYERLTLSDPFPQLNLRYAGVLPSCHEQFDHSQIQVGSK